MSDNSETILMFVGALAFLGWIVYGIVSCLTRIY
jgi:hypothetical protein